VQPGTAGDLNTGPATTTLPEQSEPERISEQGAPPASETQSKPDAALQSEKTAPAVKTKNFTVQFIARGIVWMQLLADDASPVDITLRNGERYRASAAQTLKVRLGNPTLVDVLYNDVPVSLPGKPGVPLDVVFPDIVRQPAAPME
jgi:hypothetical protein